VNRKKPKTNITACLLLGLLLSAQLLSSQQPNSQIEGHAQTQAGPYPAMAPLAQYLMADRDAEIQLARSAAPASISDHARVLVLGQHGYETAVQGSNGFVCIVERAWMSPFDDQEFWNPKIRGAICFNPASARSVLPLTHKRTELAFAGLSRIEIAARLKDAVDKKELPSLESGAMTYMMSKQSYLGDSAGNAAPHLMFYTPKQAGESWGEDLPNSPVILNMQFENSPEPLRSYIIPVSHWSDGTPASANGHKH
jgi:hypothetical protein